MKKYTTLRQLARIYNVPFDLTTDLMGVYINKNINTVPEKLIRLKWAISKHSNEKNPFTNLRIFIERGTNGFAESDAWNVDDYLCKITGGLLLQLKEFGNSYPDKYTFEAWQSQLEYHGNVLSDDKWEYDIKDQNEIDKKRKISMQWVVENLGSLWD